MASKQHQLPGICEIHALFFVHLASSDRWMLHHRMCSATYLLRKVNLRDVSETSLESSWNTFMVTISSPKIVTRDPRLVAHLRSGLLWTAQVPP